MSAAQRNEMRRFGTFVLTGGIAALANIVARWLLSRALQYELAVALAYLVGMTTAFLLARRYVFEASGRAWYHEYLRFGGVNVVAFVQVWLVSVGLYRLVFPAIGFDWHAAETAHLIGVASPILTSYYAHKHYSFRSRGQSGEGSAR